MVLKVWQSDFYEEGFVQRGYPLVLRILSAIHPTLSTLALLFPKSYTHRHISLIPVQLLNLHELIVDGSVDEESFSFSLAAPALRRLDNVTHWKLPTDFTRGVAEPDGPGGIAAISFHSVTSVLNKLSAQDQSGKLVLLAPPRHTKSIWVSMLLVKKAWEAWMFQVNGREQRRCVLGQGPAL